jgi:signal transduction histidine kinase
MREFFAGMWDTGFMPHGHCYLWKPEILWLHAISDSTIGFAYYLIPLTLIYFVHKRSDVEFRWMFVLFGAFIFACGTTHWLEVWSIWNGTYRLTGTVKALAAVVSLGTAIVLVPLVPKALALPSPAQLRLANDNLHREITRREHVEREVRELNAELERRVRERTAELEARNRDLEREISERRQAEMALQSLNEHLEDRVQGRTAQVRRLASALTLAEQRERRRVSQILHDDLQQLLYGIQLRLQVLRLNPPVPDPEGGRQMAEVEDLIARAIGTTRNLSVEMSPPVLRGEGLRATLEWLALHMEATHGLTVELDIEGECRVPNEDLRVLLFHLAKELLFNVVKHSGVDRARLTTRDAGDQLIIEVSDEGRGFQVPSTGAPGDDETGFGLSSVEERLALFGGTMSIDSAPGRGTRIRIEAPVNRGSA